VAGLALGTTNALTEAPIAQQEVIAAAEARRSVLPEAESFEQVTAPDGLSEAYAGATTPERSSERPEKS
jgi:Na+-translocating ferredoxin:NAD+ oxidoreductase RnfG subunit